MQHTSKIVHFGANIVRSGWTSLRSLPVSKAVKLAFTGLALTLSPYAVFARDIVNAPILSITSGANEPCPFVSEPTHFYSGGIAKSSLKDSSGETVCHFKHNMYYFNPNEPPLGDRLAALIDRDNFFGIPCYRTVSLEIPALEDGRIEKLKGYCIRHVSAPVLSMIGNDGFLDQISEQIPTKELHKIAILDILLGNRDRHSENVLFSGNGRLVPIDHDRCAEKLNDPVELSLFGRKSDPWFYEYSNLSDSPSYFRSFWARNHDYSRTPMRQLSEKLDPQVKKWLSKFDINEYEYHFTDPKEVQALDSIHLNQICLQEVLGYRDHTIDDYMCIQSKGFFERVLVQTIRKVKYQVQRARFKAHGNLNKRIREQFFPAFRSRCVA